MMVLFFDGKDLRLKDDYPRPSPGPSESLVRVTLAGICNTDLEITKGFMGFQGVLGHEFVGVVEESTDEELLGKRVVGEINIPCKRCRSCLDGMVRHCPNRRVLGILGWDGCLGEYIILPNANLHVLPDCVSDKEAVFCEPLASALQILEQVQVRPQDRVVVLGDGKLGLLIAQVLRFATADLVVIGRHQVKLGILSRQRIKTQIGTKGVCDVDIVVECTGKPEGFQEAISMVKPGGKVILKSTFSGCSLQSTNLLVINEITVLGSRCGPFRPAIMWLKEGRIDTSSLITEIYSLKMGLEAFRCSRSSEALKVLVRP